MGDMERTNVIVITDEDRGYIYGVFKSEAAAMRWVKEIYANLLDDMYEDADYIGEIKTEIAALNDLKDLYNIGMMAINSVYDGEGPLYLYEE